MASQRFWHATELWTLRWFWCARVPLAPLPPPLLPLQVHLLFGGGGAKCGRQAGGVSAVPHCLHLWGGHFDRAGGEQAGAELGRHLGAECWQPPLWCPHSRDCRRHGALRTPGLGGGDLWRAVQRWIGLGVGGGAGEPAGGHDGVARGMVASVPLQRAGGSERRCAGGRRAEGRRGGAAPARLHPSGAVKGAAEP
eukprot:8256476-Pyramimonas_sp.AAC.1